METIGWFTNVNRVLRVGLVATLVLAPRVGVTQQLSAATVPLKDPGADSWHFYGSALAVGVDVHKGVKQIGANVDGISLTDPKFLWRYEFHVSDRNRDVLPKERGTDGGLMYVGNGPLSLLDVDAGKVRWTLECDQVGFVNLNRLTPLPGERLLLVGSKECKHSLGASYDDARIVLLNNRNGQTLWEHPTKTQGFDIELDAPPDNLSDIFYGFTVDDKKEYQIFAIPLAPGAGGYHYSTGADADRVLVVGERLEELTLADGKLLWSGKDKIGRYHGMNGPLAFASDGGKLSAYDAGTGQLAWSLDVGGSANKVDLSGPTGLARAGVLVSTPNTVLLVDLATGQKKWELREGNLLKAVATASAGAATVTLLVDRGKWDKGKQRFQGPYRFWGVDVNSGKVLWNRDAAGGKKIVDFDLVHDGQLRLAGEGAARFENLNIADGTAATPPPGADEERYVTYSKADKALRCYDYAGNVVWDRKGEISDQADFAVRRTRGGIVIWPAKSGTVEVLALSDGKSLWKMDAGGNPQAHVTQDGAVLLVPHGGTVAIVHLSQ